MVQWRIAKCISSEIGPLALYIVRRPDRQRNAYDCRVIVQQGKAMRSIGWRSKAGGEAHVSAVRDVLCFNGHGSACSSIHVLPDECGSPRYGGKGEYAYPGVTCCPGGRQHGIGSGIYGL